jgi:WD40 repeat protein
MARDQKCIILNECKGKPMYFRWSACLHSTQRVSSSLFTADARFVLTGSDDGNIRIWKAKASEKLGIITARERAAIEYRDTLKDRWKHDNEVGRIQR